MMNEYQICVVIIIGVLHVPIMLLEMVPPTFPVLLKLLSKRRLRSLADDLALPQHTLGNVEALKGKFTPSQQTFVANIVKNSGIYNGIVAAGLVAAACTGDYDVARVLLTGVTVAGVFGAFTLSPVVWGQAALGIGGIALLYLLRS